MLLQGENWEWDMTPQALSMLVSTVGFKKRLKFHLSAPHYIALSFWGLQHTLEKWATNYFTSCSLWIDCLSSSNLETPNTDCRERQIRIKWMMCYALCITLCYCRFFLFFCRKGVQLEMVWKFCLPNTLLLQETKPLVIALLLPPPSLWHCMISIFCCYLLNIGYCIWAFSPVPF